MEEQEKTLFPDEEVIDYEEGWVVASIDAEGKKIKFQGQNKNAHLEFILGFEDDPDFFDEKVQGYLEIKEKIQADLKEKYEKNQISENEAMKPILVTEYFPKEFFMEPKLDSVEIDDF